MLVPNMQGAKVGSVAKPNQTGVASVPHIKNEVLTHLLEHLFGHFVCS